MVSKPSVPQIRREAICSVGYGNSKTENTQSTVIHEKTDMSGQVWHCVEGVGCSAGQGKDDTHKHVCEQWPGVAIMLEIQRIPEVTQDPKEIPGGQEMSPEVEGFIGGIKHTEDALKRGALRVAVAADDEMLMEMFWNLVDLVGGTGKSDWSHPGQLLPGKRIPLLYILVNHNSVLITKNSYTVYQYKQMYTNAEKETKFIDIHVLIR